MTNQINNQSIIPSTDVIQLSLTLKMTTAQVVAMSVSVNNNSPIQDYVHPDDQTQPTFEMTPGFKPFTVATILFPDCKTRAIYLWTTLVKVLLNWPQGKLGHILKVLSGVDNFQGQNSAELKWWCVSFYWGTKRWDIIFELLRWSDPYKQNFTTDAGPNCCETKIQRLRRESKTLIVVSTRSEFKALTADLFTGL